ncbi:hypothetical protein BO71DRAFT_399050 [Aspergillus ellipticus CBS 707.79]|uniref:Uncharacterized protein n=1 Tax=Aspergillus ellipticus CBS 707.79 TaxID=1448320 RepID=A0A319ET08_9EURO|nr:hypothetical protein BO71DRAFT_399050 [Aspergillus ellipticus CBS 707.79]
MTGRLASDPSAKTHESRDFEIGRVHYSVVVVSFSLSPAYINCIRRRGKKIK